HLEYDGYKAHRKGMPEELAMQLPYVKEACGILGFTVLSQEGYEADDILGTIAKQCVGAGFSRPQIQTDVRNGRENPAPTKTYILTGDKDSFQLISNNVTVLYLSNMAVIEYTPEKIREVYGIEPEQLICVKALMGDSSDEIPGVRGIGEKTALKLIQENKSLDGVYKNLDDGTLQITPANKQKLTDGRANAYMSRKLAEICCTVPVSPEIFTPRRAVDKARLYDFCKNLELNSIIKKLDLKPDTNTNEQLDIFDMLENIGVERDDLGALEFKVSEISDKFSDGEMLFVMIEFDRGAMYINDNKLFFRIAFDNIAELTPVFSGKYKICTNRTKEIYLKFKQAGIKIDQNIFKFDLELAAYVLNPSHTKHDFSNDAAYSQLYHEMSQKLKDINAEDLYYNVELPLALVLAEMEYEGFLTDTQSLLKFGEELNIKASGMQQEIYDLTGVEFNINSPKQLGEVLFGLLKLPGGKKNKTGGYSTNIDVMMKLKSQHPAVALILEYRAVTKLKSTYCDGLVKLSDANGRLHTSFNQTITATGRLSSTEPNLQNIPVRTNLGREIRKFFIAKDGYVLIAADYSQIELRVLAHISGDETLIDAFVNGRDIHRLTASQVFGVAEQDVTGDMRRMAKAVNFGIIYGMSDFSLSEDIGVSVKEAREYIAGYFLTYPKVQKFMDGIIASAKETGYVKTILNRIRYIPELKMSNRNMVGFGERIARNTPIQGSAADIIKLAMLACHKRFKEENLKSRLILQVHDELIFEAYADETELVSQIVRHEMENVYKMSVPLVVDISVGKSWYDTKE
ncbi:MAG: DNA polymerase I, partial [Oscillospiraceae bacterium]|nr:DNA polymerase I [Oscillospiraceae bacterium]